MSGLQEQTVSVCSCMSGLQEQTVHWHSANPKIMFESMRFRQWHLQFHGIIRDGRAMGPQRRMWLLCAPAAAASRGAGPPRDCPGNHDGPAAEAVAPRPRRRSPGPGGGRSLETIEDKIIKACFADGCKVMDLTRKRDGNQKVSHRQHVLYLYTSESCTIHVFYLYDACTH